MSRKAWPCPNCNGTGTVEDEYCAMCEGEGYHPALPYVIIIVIITSIIILAFI